MKKNYTREDYKDKSIWLNHRGFGGSSASAILNKNPYMSKLELYKSCISANKSKKKDSSNEATIYGTKCEPLIRKMFALDYPQYKVHSPKEYEMYRRIDKPYLTATLDGILTDKITKEKGILEIKTHDIRNREDDENWKVKLPDNYYIQVLHYLLVMNDFKFVILCAKLRYFDYHNKNGKKLLRQEIRYYYIDRKEVEKDLEYLEQKETEFYEENIVKRIIPKVEIEFKKEKINELHLQRRKETI